MTDHDITIINYIWADTMYLAELLINLIMIIKSKLNVYNAFSDAQRYGRVCGVEKFVDEWGCLP